MPDAEGKARNDDCLFYIFFAQGLEQKAPENDFLDVVHAEHADYVKDAL